MPQHIAWHDFHFDVPDEWEVTAYSVERRVGSFLPGYTEPDLPAQAYAYLEGPRKLLRWIFDPPAATPTPPESWAPLLATFRPNAGDVRDFSLFGLRFRLPADYAIERMNTLPANVMIVFENSAHRRATFRRWGLPDLILAGEPLDVFYGRILRTAGCKVVEARPEPMLGHPGVTLRYEQRGEYQMDRFLATKWTGEARLWHNREEERLYAFERIGPRKTAPLDFRKVFA